VSANPDHWSDDRRALSLEATLGAWDRNTPVWIFGYGSLIWRPEFEYEIKTRAQAHGYHRSLCLWSRVYRGTPECPGLVLGLEPGGSCNGVAFLIAAQNVKRELRALWEREMVTGSYVPRWLKVRTHQPGVPQHLRALGFVMDRQASGYAGELDRATLLATVRRARGERGSSADYLLTTVRCLAEYGIHDPHLAELAEEVMLTGGAPALGER
jgi:cation transport protein ChaC